MSGSIKGLSNDINPGGLLLQLGSQKVLTDNDGNFAFTDLVPDKYYLRVLSPLSEKGIVPVDRGPVEVAVEPESNQHIEIGFVKAGSIIGNVLRNEPNEIRLPNDDQPKAVIMVKLYNETESFLTMVNDNNGFSFKEIKPGVWNLKAIVKGEQERIEVVNEERRINLEPGAVVETTFETRPIERKIYFSKQGFDLTAKKKE